MKNRLAKILAQAGVASRRKCEALIQAGRVQLNGERVLIPQTPASLDEDQILVDGKPITGSKNIYIVLNKPRGYVCTHAPIRNGKRVVDLFSSYKERLFTIGRLDKETTGLLLLTNDGQLANRIIHPRYGIQKEYLAKTAQEITPRHLDQIRRGTVVEGSFVKPARVQKVRRNKVKITVQEGRKREVRVMLANAGLKVLELKRIRIGNLHLGQLPIGEWREVSRMECEKVLS